MAGGAAGTPNQMGSASPAAPSQASQYSNYGAQPNGAFYAGPMSGAPASGGSYAQPSMPTYQSQPMQSYQPQFGGGYGQGYGSPFGGMGGFPGQGFGGMGNQFMGGGYGYQPQPQYGFGGMGNQFMGGGMGGFDPYGGRPARSFGGRDMYGPRGGFDPRMAMQQMYGQQAVAQPAATAAPAVQRTEEDWARSPMATNASYANQEGYDAAKKAFMEGGAQQPQGLAEIQRMLPPQWMNRRRGPYFGPEY